MVAKQCFSNASLLYHWNSILRESFSFSSIHSVFSHWSINMGPWLLVFLLRLWFVTMMLYVVPLSQKKPVTILQAGSSVVSICPLLLGTLAYHMAPIFSVHPGLSTSSSGISRVPFIGDGVWVLRVLFIIRVSLFPGVSSKQTQRIERRVKVFSYICLLTCLLFLSFLNLFLLLYFKSLLSGTNPFRVAMFSWSPDRFIAMECPSLSLLIFLFWSQLWC